MLKAYHSDPAIKQKYLNRVLAHKENDELIKGVYWGNGKGCAVGCTIHSSQHNRYEIELGIPEWLAKCEDLIFENLPSGEARQWPIQFLKTIVPGVELKQIKKPFLIFILESSLKSLGKVQFNKQQFPDIQEIIEKSKMAVKEMIRCHENNLNLNKAAKSARSVASAESAARSAAWSAAWSAESAAWSAAVSAESAAWSVARSAAWRKFAKKLLKLISEL